MKFSDPLGHPWIAPGMISEQVFCLIFEVVEIRIRREASYRHTNFLS